MAANCNSACWWRCPQSPRSQSKLCGLFSIKKTETTQFLVNDHSSYIRFGGSATSPAMCSRGLGCFPNKHFVLHKPCLRVSSFLKKRLKTMLVFPADTEGSKDLWEVFPNPEAYLIASLLLTGGSPVSTFVLFPVIQVAMNGPNRERFVPAFRRSNRTL